jgi:hypothetical protein
MHIEFLLEEESSAVTLDILMPKMLRQGDSWKNHPFQGKLDLLNKLPSRLKGYASWLPNDWRIVVLVDRDNDDCLELKAKLEEMARRAGLVTKTASRGNSPFRVLNRIATEELEAWFLGDVDAIVAAYPKVPRSLAARRGYRDPDAIAGGTSEALERALQKAGYYATGIPKVEVARNVATHMQPQRNQSHCFNVFWTGMAATIASANKTQAYE